jgi:hypothetical protein
MPRVSSTQRQRTQNNPLLLGPFSQLSIRNLTGSLGPEDKVIPGGYGGGTYNHWFQIEISSPAWIILAKGGSRKKYINLSVYDLNLQPILSRGIFDRDSIKEIDNGDVYYPYQGHVMAAGSDLYNNFNPNRFDKGDDRYFPLETGSYLLCISSTRNEKIDYEVAIVIEFPSSADNDLLAENFEYILWENDDLISLEIDSTFIEDVQHSHSLVEWKTAWEREQQLTKPFPAILIPYATRP